MRLLGGLLCALLALRVGAEPPNVVLMIVDTLRADRVAAARNGVQVMPHVRALAEKGWTFTRAYAQSSWTKPSVTSILTGLYPRTHGVVHGSQLTLKPDAAPEPVEGVAPEKELAAEYFKRQGYATFGAQTNQLLRSSEGYARGFDTYLEVKYTSALQVNKQVYQFAARLKPPFFLYLHYIDPHMPYGPGKAGETIFGSLPELNAESLKRVATPAAVENYYLQFWHKSTGDAPKALPPFTAPERDYLRQLYDVDCRTADAGIGKMVEEITRHWPDTLFVIVADHGEEFWDHGAMGHGKTLFEELIHVPLILFQGTLKPRVIETPVEALDVLPTIAALCGLPPNSNWQGRSLAADTLEDRPSFSETLGTIRDTGVALEAVVQGPQKLVRGAQGDALYALDGSTAETQDLSLQRPEATQALARLLDAHRAACDAHSLAKVPPAKTALDPAMLDRLRGLGHLGK